MRHDYYAGYRDAKRGAPPPPPAPPPAGSHETTFFGGHKVDCWLCQREQRYRDEQREYDNLIASLRSGR